MPAPAPTAVGLPTELTDLPQLRRRACRHGTMLYSVNDIYIGRSLELYGEYVEAEARLYKRLLEPGDVGGGAGARWYKRLLERGDVVVEAGANIGAFTLPIAKRIGLGGHVHAFEPQ